ncbi:unnamed protein product [Blepharisma stoltei]|uniref:EGF-like domain-containing protein n=1 Tax=Blepharisma stoltei TaxID=1481888 RepID=A0AAU9K204_9CILI|nr:unnamed protein product [Blepharisma stoltei]
MILIYILIITVDTLSCSEYGHLVRIMGDNYYCNGIQVSRDEYYLNVSSNQCEQSTFISDACLCPEDYYGLYCEKKRKINCDLTLIFPIMDSCIFNSKYNPSIPGFSNCLRVSNQTNLLWTVKPQCKTITNGTYIDEYYLQDFNDTNSITILDNTEFIYVYNDGSFITSNIMKGYLILNFIDYNRPSSQYGYFKYYINEYNFEGIQVNFSVNIDTIPTHSKVNGRWYYEIFIDKPIQSSTIRSVIDDASWTNPPMSHPFSFLFIAWICLGLFGVILFCYLIYSYFQKRKLKFE